MDRTYPVENEAVIEVERQKFVDHRCSVDIHVSSSAGSCTLSPSLSAMQQFVPRSAASEQQRNAVTVDDSSKMLIRTRVLAEILSRATDLVMLDNRTWNKGGRFGTHTFFHGYKILYVTNVCLLPMCVLNKGQSYF